MIVLRDGEIVELTDEEWAASNAPPPEPPPPPTLDDLKAAKKAAVLRIFDAKFAAGFAPTGTMAGETLQVATVIDRTNWLTSLGAYQIAIAAGQGAVEGAMFRTTSNTNYRLTFDEGLQVLLAMIQWGQAMYATLWDKKDAIEAAEDEAALGQIAPAFGWPT